MLQRTSARIDHWWLLELCLTVSAMLVWLAGHRLWVLVPLIFIAQVTFYTYEWPEIGSHSSLKSALVVSAVSSLAFLFHRSAEYSAVTVLLLVMLAKLLPQEIMYVIHKDRKHSKN